MNSQKPRVLIFGVAAVQADALKFLKQMGCETYACARAADGPGAEVADHFEPIDFTDEAAVTRWIETENIDIIYSVGSDLAMPVAMKLSAKLGKRHFVSADTAYACNNKDLLRDRLAHMTVGNIRSQSLAMPGDFKADEITFPVIVKPADSQGQRGIFIAESEAEVYRYFAKAREFSRSGIVIVEEFIEGPEYSVNGYVVDGEPVFVLASDRETWPQFTGLIHRHLVPTRILSDAEQESIRSVIVEACHLLNIENGPVYAQMKVRDGRPYIIEVTPRLDGCHMWKLINSATGFNLLKLAFEQLLYDDTSELAKLDDLTVEKRTLTFFCREPHTIMNREELIVPDDALDHDYYYKTGETIRPVNRLYEKIGYYITAE